MTVKPISLRESLKLLICQAKNRRATIHPVTVNGKHYGMLIAQMGGKYAFYGKNAHEDYNTYMLHSLTLVDRVLPSYYRAVLTDLETLRYLQRKLP
jgi:hypothetical protein